ncbi:SMP-30/gluconolactonase/LRE family protein [Rhizobium halophytocola]|uniref:Sugar lactone lactonase YvrE n=1 Tax=Rhizobium halophytocola TaxID=735519 RepID=A0ABS4DXM3_9HYPH|nr:SMP-30/gluconolactonase/LRE family protein [Rhizobium halophytocola]MBP1850436.1 sugar lactone lactonase YvrE [Rhizobium halophytocola]
MVETVEFTGTILCAQQLTLGEGPTYDPTTDTAWWFNIKGRELHQLQLSSGEKQVHALPFMASVLARIDGHRQLMATEDGLFLRETDTGVLTFLTALEPEKPGNRSNDGRVHRSGALWIGTMGKSAEEKAGAIYHVAGGKVTTLFPQISIPNAICFSPDGATAYYTDSKIGHLMTVKIDPHTGLPLATPQVLIENDGALGDFDGAVCDADGDIINARWGAGAVDRYDSSGQHVARYLVPARQPSCPAFIGPALDRLLVTTARDGLGDAATPADGQTFELGITVRGRAEPDYRL